MVSRWNAWLASVNCGLGYAAIQHYGIPTSLLDWTANPSVAVHFAACGKASKTSPKAEVLCLTSENMAAINPRIVVPPPYIRRLYLQRGVFTDLTAEQAEDVERRCQKILFPAQPELPACSRTMATRPSILTSYLRNVRLTI